MNNIIRRIEITGFRSLDSVQIVCDEVNVFSGLNDVGKSNVLRALNLFFNERTDLGVPVNFLADYSKLSLAKAQTSAHQKQQIKIRVYFRPPASFKSLQNEELWLERTYDRFGRPGEKSSLDDSPKRASLTRLVNSVRYFYIPALKGANVLEYILGEIGKRNLMSSDDIANLNRNVNNNIKDFADILSGSSIDIKTNFELPVLVQDFWQRLNVNTRFDEFLQLDTETGAVGTMGAKLREEAYQISLLARGEGLKSKYVPPLLKWIQEHEASKYFVWGIDEPENSLEFKKAQEVANLYFDSYSKNTQIFLTSHSLAFIFPSTPREHVTIFRCVKTGHGDIDIYPLDDLFAQQTQYELADELGALEIQKEVIESWRVKDEEFTQISMRLNEITQPVILVEGSIDKVYMEKALDVYGRGRDFPFQIATIGTIDRDGNERGNGADSLNKMWQLRQHVPADKLTVLFYDVDCRKPIERDGNVVIYCPAMIEGQVYAKGVEHLLVFPEDYRKEDYMTRRVKGDHVILEPDKNKIKDYVLGLPKDGQKACLQHVYARLVEIEGTYSS